MPCRQGSRSWPARHGGACGLRPVQFVVWDLVGMVFAVPLALPVGYFVGKPAVDFLEWLIEVNAMGGCLAGLVGLGLAMWGIRRVVRNRRTAAP